MQKRPLIKKPQKNVNKFILIDIRPKHFKFNANHRLNVEMWIAQ